MRFKSPSGIIHEVREQINRCDYEAFYWLFCNEKIIAEYIINQGMSVYSGWKRVNKKLLPTCKNCIKALARELEKKES